MKHFPILLSVIIAVFLSGCGNQNVNPVESNQTNKQGPASELLKPNSNFRAHLDGDEEVPPVNTRAQGQAIFRLSSDGNSMYYKLIAANIENITMAHIHLGAVGATGGVVVWLYPDAPPAVLIPGRFNGVLAEGTITDANLVGALAGMTMADLVSEMINDNAYVNIHTSQNPSGEIRGQIK